MLFGVVTFVLLAGRRVQTTDEAWFLWVAHRLAHGDVLYRNTYSVTAPLSHWLSAAAVAVFGTQVLVIRALSVGCFVATAELIRRAAAARGLGPAGQAVLLGALLAVGSPVAVLIAFYSGLAFTLAVGAWYCVAGRPGHITRVRVAVAGVLAGLSFQTKPNVGLLALVAVAATLLSRYGPSRAELRAQLAIVIATFAAVVVSVLIAVAATGGLSGYLDYVFLNKVGYLTAGVSFLRELRHTVGLAIGIEPVRTVSDLMAGLLPLLPLLAVAATVVAILRSGRAWRAWVGPAALLLIGLGSLVPRPTSTHVAAAAPLLVAGALLACVAVEPPGGSHAARRSAVAVGAVLVMVVLSIVTVRSVDGLTGQHAALPHFADVPVNAHQASRLRARLAELHTMTGGKVFIVRTDAGYLSLIGGLTDPTPFDIPERTDFGPGGESDAIRTIRENHVAFACLREHVARRLRPQDGLRPIRLERYLQHHFTRERNLGVCQLYRRRDSA